MAFLHQAAPVPRALERCGRKKGNLLACPRLNKRRSGLLNWITDHGKSGRQTVQYRVLEEETRQFLAEVRILTRREAGKGLRR
ncbi:hypothetical protein CH238_04825 [[Clostridium] leptum DSM 753]|uniref:Uncharacterized protein n=1 Tax=[Clostridium] leptum DSM 753 TaxID=428125 RepID=A0A855A7A7_9FIRM|nr:hypothetical protein CH238_04825 [[Clostridium] leptum DSM 753]